MTKTQFLSWLFNGICALIAAGGEFLADTPNVASYFPPKYAHAIAVASMLAIALKAQRNLKINRDGTPDVVAYVPNDGPAIHIPKPHGAPSAVVEQQPDVKALEAQNADSPTKDRP